MSFLAQKKGLDTLLKSFYEFPNVSDHGDEKNCVLKPRKITKIR